MNKTLKTLVTLVVSSTLVLGTMAGCASKKQDPNQAGKKSKPVTLKIMLPGDRPKDWDTVKAEAEKRMESTINVKLDVSFAPWTDIDQKSKIAMTSGEEWDLVWDAPEWPHYEEMAQGGYYEPIDDLLKQFGPNILKNRPAEMIDANKINGKSYGVPLEIRYAKPWGFYVRQDLREKYGMKPLKTWEDLVAFMRKVKENEKNIIPFVPYDVAFAPFRLTAVRNPAMNLKVLYGMSLYTKNNDGKVYNFLDDPDPKVMNQLQEIRQLFKDGIISQDTLKLTSTEFEKGKAAVTANNDIGIRDNVKSSLTKAIPGAKAEFVALDDISNQSYSTYKAGNFICVPVSSKNKEAAIKFLDWANQKDNYDLLAYGIKGKDWEEGAENTYKVLPTNQYVTFAYDLIWNPTLDRISSDLDPQALKIDKYFRDSKNFKPDKLTGFTFNPKAVKNEIARYNKMNLEMWRPILGGVLDYDTNMPKFKEKAYPILKKIQVEYQKQIDEFLKNKK